MFVFRGENSNTALSKTTSERLWVELMLAAKMVRPVEEGENRYRGNDIRSRYVPLITPHTMRHNYITMCWENGFDVYVTQKLVGHKSIKTTMDIYTHLSNRQLEKAKAQVNLMFSEGGQKNKSCTKVAQLDE